MALPGSFPAWLSASGQPDALIFNAAGYNAAVAQGYAYPTAPSVISSPVAAPLGQPVTPVKTVSAQVTIAEVSLNVEQNDGRPAGAVSRGSKL